MPRLTPPLELSRRMASLQPSATFAMVARVKQLRREGHEVLDLTAGEPDFAAPGPAGEAGILAIREGRGRYTPAAGMPELREEVAAWIRREVGLDYQPQEVVVTPGAKLGINEVLLALVESGQEVLCLSPYWTSYPDMVRLADGEPVLVPCGPDHLPSLEALEAARTGRTSLLLLNTPNNPTGSVYPAALLQEIGAWALEHGIRVISDEIYGSLTYEGAAHVSPLKAVPEWKEQGAWICGVSKAYAMTGWRIGFVAAPEPLARAVASLQSQLASCPSAISQWAALEAMRSGDREREVMRAAFERRARMVTTAFEAMPGVRCPRPLGAFYAFPRIDSYLGRTDPETGRTVSSGDDFTELLLEADRVATMGGTGFGVPEAFRISFAAADEVLEEALRRIAARLAALAA